MTASSTARATSAFDARATCVSPAAVRIVTSLSGDSKPMSARAMSLTTTASSALARELVAAVLERALAVLGGEADQRLVGAARARQAGEDVRRALELDAHALVGGLLELAGAAAGRAKVGDRGGHQQHVAVGEGGGARLLKLGGGLDVDVVHAQVALQRDVRGDDRRPRRRARRPARRARSPSGPTSGCRRSGTASIGSRVPPAVTSTRRPARCGRRRGARDEPSIAASSPAGSGRRPGRPRPWTPAAPCPARAR